MAKVTDDDLKALQAKVAQLVADKADADAKTQASNAADTAAAQAAAVASQAKLDESAADAKASADLTDLVSFVESLAGAPMPPPA